MTTGDDEPTMADVTATCRTEDCANAGAAIVLTIPEGCGIVCGVCGEPITDVAGSGS
jgi:hypothetical protein